MRRVVTPRRRVEELQRPQSGLFRARLAEDYDGIGQYVLVALAGSSISGAYKARVAAGDFGGNQVIPRGSPVIVHSNRGQLEVFLGNIPLPPDIKLVQKGSGRAGNFDCIVNLEQPTSPKNFLFAFIDSRSGIPSSFPANWTALTDGLQAHTHNDWGRFFYTRGDGQSSYNFGTANQIATIWEVEGLGGIHLNSNVFIYKTQQVSGTSFNLGLVDDSPLSLNQLVLLGLVYHTGFDGNVWVTPGTGWILDHNQGWQDGAADSDPHHYSAHWDKTELPLSGTGTFDSGSRPYAGGMIQLGRSPLIVPTAQVPLGLDQWIRPTAINSAEALGSPTLPTGSQDFQSDAFQSNAFE